LPYFIICVISTFPFAYDVWAVTKRPNNTEGVEAPQK
jgi:hypothetical protein